ncbi:HNH endonuclease family protein [Streptomyces nogalater]
MVPLVEAWDSGASSWSARERQDYANDLGDDRSLVAVTDRFNQAKADQDPAEWMPSATCRYIADWATVKTRWGLTADPAEHAALQKTAARCDGPEITVELAR